MKIINLIPKGNDILLGCVYIYIGYKILTLKLLSYT